MTRTLSDWLARARDGGDTAEVERCLDAAMSLASSGSDWLQILRALSDGPLGSRERLAGAARRTLEAAGERGEVWGFREAARVRATILGDEAGAREALEAGVCAFGARKARGYQWALLANGFVETLGDTEGARRCLDAGHAAARAMKDVHDLCSIATATAQLLGDRRAAESIVNSAERLARDAGSAWTVAVTWNALGERDRAARVLDEAMKRTATCEEALHLARAYSSLGFSSGVHRALDDAAEVADSAGEWLEVAETAFDTKQGSSRIGMALVRAMAAAGEDDKPRVAAGYRTWLHDHEAAFRLGPSGVRPEALRVPARRLDGWQGSASGLLDWLRARIPHDTLVKIAGADYGQAVEKHLAPLVDICATGLVPRRPGWHPGEVLELTRWSSGERVDHLERAFACTLICLWDDIDGLGSTAAILVESCVELGAEPSALAAQLFAWRCETADAEGDRDDGIQPVPLLALIVLAAAADPLDPRLPGLVRTLEDNPWCSPAELARSITETVRAALWPELFDRLLAPARARSPAIVRLLDLLGHGSAGRTASR